MSTADQRVRMRLQQIMPELQYRFSSPVVHAWLYSSEKIDRRALDILAAHILEYVVTTPNRHARRAALHDAELIEDILIAVFPPKQLKPRRPRKAKAA